MGVMIQCFPGGLRSRGAHGLDCAPRLDAVGYSRIPRGRLEALALEFLQQKRGFQQQRILNGKEEVEP